MMFRLPTHTLLAGLLATGLWSAAGATERTVERSLEQRLETLVEEIEKSRIKHHVPGCALVVVKDGKVILAKGFGHADREQQKAVTPDTGFFIGSSTKAFTATLLGMLVDDGKLSWDDPVAKHLPYFDLNIDSPTPEDQATIRDLLSHRTGFPRMGVLWAAGNLTPDEVLKQAAKGVPFTPFRRSWHYNNVMYLAAGWAGAAADSDNWHSQIDKRILKPLGMTNTYTYATQAQKKPYFAQGYMWLEGLDTFLPNPARRGQPSVDSVAPAGSISSTANDMGKWLRFLLAEGKIDGKPLIQEKTLRETWQPQAMLSGDIHYGLGWMLRQRKGATIIEHGGNVLGFSTEVALFPESNLGFALLTNSHITPLQQHSIELVASALIDPPADTSSNQVLDYTPYLGRYLANFGPFSNEVFTVDEENGVLALDIPSQRTYALKNPDENGKWEFALTDQIAVTFKQDDKQQAQGLYIHQAGMTFFVPRQEQKSSTPEDNVKPIDKVIALRKSASGNFSDWLKPSRISGKIHFKTAAVDGNYVITTAGPNYFKTAIDIGRYGSIHFSVDNDRAWTDSTFEFEPFREIAGKRRQQIRQLHPASIFGNWRESFDKVSLIQTTYWKGTEVHVVRLSSKGLPPIQLRIDAQNGDVLSLETTLLPHGIPMTSLFEDYRQVHGIRLPFKQTDIDSQSGQTLFQVDKFDIDVALDKDEFDLRKHRVSTDQ